MPAGPRLKIYSYCKCPHYYQYNIVLNGTADLYNFTSLYPSLQQMFESKRGRHTINQSLHIITFILKYFLTANDASSIMSSHAEQNIMCVVMTACISSTRRNHNFCGINPT